jgi:hypothetical protein
LQNICVPFLLLALLALSPLAAHAQWRDLFPNGSMEAWQPVGDGVWKMRSDGVLVGMRDPKNSLHQAWLYTRDEFTAFDLKLEYWTKWGGNGGVSLRDTSRGRFAVGTTHDGDKTPSHIGYEIQIMNLPEGGGKYPTGSVYLFEPAKDIPQKPFDWNELEIRSRKDKITVFVNGAKVAEHPGDPKRPISGPIGLQLHDPASYFQFRNVRIRPLR